MAKLNKSTSTSAKMKASGAGYSTTSRSGKQTFYSSSSDSGMAKPIGTSKVGVSVVKAPDVGSVAPATLPTKPTPVDPGALNLDGAFGQSIVAGQYQALPPAETDTLDASNQRQQNNFLTATQQLLGIGANDKGMADYQKMEKQAGIKKMQDEVNQYSGTLNSIVANRDAAMLSLEDQGRGQTSGFIGGEQGRINREAAIAALPVQAQLASAQGNLEVAQARLDKLFSIHQQDVKAQYDFKVGIVNSLYQFMDKQETNRANQLIAKEGQKYQEKQNNINYLRSLSSMAIQTGQQGLISKLGAIDPNSVTFEQDVAAIQSQIRMPTSPTESKPITQLIGDTLYQYDSATGSWSPVAGGTVTPGGQDSTNLDAKYTSLLNDISVARGMKDQVGAGWIERNIKNAVSGNNKPAQLDNITNTIKSNLLTLNTDPAIKKFFGPQMSNRDTELMMGAAGTLDPVKQSPAEYEKDLRDAANLIVRAREAVRVGMQKEAPMSVPTNIIISPDGMEIQLID